MTKKGIKIGRAVLLLCVDPKLVHYKINKDDKTIGPIWLKLIQNLYFIPEYVYVNI